METRTQFERTNSKAPLLNTKNKITMEEKSQSVLMLLNKSDCVANTLVESPSSWLSMLEVDILHPISGQSMKFFRVQGFAKFT